MKFTNIQKVKLLKLSENDIIELIIKYIYNTVMLDYIHFYQKVNFDFNYDRNTYQFNNYKINLYNNLHLYGYDIFIFQLYYFKHKYKNLNNNELKNIIEI